jgi:CheY-like chemotaxis protein
VEKFLAGWFDVVITDRAMADMSGDQLAIAIKKIAPNKTDLDGHRLRQLDRGI